MSMLFALKATSKIPLRLVLSVVLAAGFYCPAAHANGWEHTSIDFSVLVAALNDKNPNLRRRAAESLGFRPQAGVTDALLARLSQVEPVARVRQEIFHALGKIGEASAVDAIADCIANETSIPVRAQCAAAVGNFSSAVAEDLALKATNDENLQVRLQAVASLGGFSGEAAVQALTGFVEGADGPIRNTALLALGRTGAAAATVVLVETLRQENSREQILLLLRALTLLANPDALEVIQALYRRSDDEEVKRHALVAMANTRARGSESYFLEALSSEDHASQILGLAALRNFGSNKQAAAVTERALIESNNLFSRDSRQLLKQPLQSIDDLRLLNEYLKTIVRLDPKTGGHLYEQAIKSRSIPPTSATNLKIAQGFYEARWQSIYGLGYAGTAQAAELIAATLNDPDPRIRAVATRSLGVSGQVKYIDGIEKMLLDEAAEVRWMAARVLGRLKAQDSADAIIQSLDDTNAQVRLESAIALGYLNTHSAKSKLSELAIKDPDPRVQEAAVYAASLIR